MKSFTYCLALYWLFQPLSSGGQEAVLPLSYQVAGQSYLQDFDGLPLTGIFSLPGKGPFALSAAPVNGRDLKGWFIMMTWGSASNAQFLTGTGSGTASGAYSFGNSGSADRTLGSLASSSGIYAFGLLLTNDTGLTLDSCTLSLTAKQWRKGGSGHPNTYPFGYACGPFLSPRLSGLTPFPSLDLHSVISSVGATALNGNLPANQYFIQQSIGSLHWKPGEQLLLRWDDRDEPGNDDALSIDQFSFTASGIVPTDIIIPEIKAVTIPDKSMKIGDTVRVSISVNSYPDIYQLAGGFINSLPLTRFTKVNDSFYNASFVVTEKSNDIATGKPIPVYLVLKTISGNSSEPYTTPIQQPNTFISANRPLITNIQPPADKLYKANDTLSFLVQFSKPVLIDTTEGIPAIALTIGSKIKMAYYVKGHYFDKLLFCYVIPPGEIDLKGIRLNSPIRLNAGSITDLAGNAAMLATNQAAILHQVKVDAVVPVISKVSVPAATVYPLGAILHFTVYFSKTVQIDTNAGKPSLLVNIGGMIRHADYSGGTNSKEIKFQYQVTNTDLDKKGIRLAAALSLNEASITDSAGNEAILILKNIGALSNVKVDGIGPAFEKNNPAEIVLCEDTKTFLLSDLLGVTDLEIGEMLTWTMISLPSSGNISGIPASKVSTKGILLPGNVWYTPASSGAGDDRFSIQVSDGHNNAILQVVVTAVKPAGENIISNNQLICAGSNPAKLTGTKYTDTMQTQSYLWEYSFITDTTGFQPAPGSNDQSDYAPPVMEKNAWFRRKIITGVCTSFSAPIKITVLKSGLWLGGYNTEWDHKKNWCGSMIPSISTNVVIPSGTIYAPHINSLASCNRLIMTDGASLTVSSMLQLGESIDAAPESILVSEGGIELCGMLPQNISTNIFHRRTIHQLIVNNNNVHLNDTLFLSGILLLKKGMLETNNLLFLKQGGVIGPAAMGSRILGDIHMEHQLAVNSWNLLAHPFAKELAPGSLTCFSDSACYNTTFYSFDENAGYFSFEKKASWIPFNKTNNTNTPGWKKHQGIAVQTPQSQASLVYSWSGPVNQNNQELHFSADQYKSYRLAVNPYPCPVNMHTVSRSKGIAPYYWIWNNQQGLRGGYTAIPFKNHVMVPSFASFFIKTQAFTENHLLFTEHSKLTQELSESFPDTGEDLYHLELRFESDSLFWDRLLLFNIESAHDKTDSLDGEKIMNPDLSFYSFSSDKDLLSVDARPFHSKTIIPIGIRSNISGLFRIRVARKHFPEKMTLYLHDKLLDQWMVLGQDSSYYFVLNHHLVEKNNDRFEITAFKKEITAIRIPSALSLSAYPVPANDQLVIRFKTPGMQHTFLNLFSQNGILVKSYRLGLQQEGNFRIAVADLPKGIYILELKCGNDVVIRKIIKS